MRNGSCTKEWNHDIYIIIKFLHFSIFWRKDPIQLFYGPIQSYIFISTSNRFWGYTLVYILHNYTYQLLYSIWRMPGGPSSIKLGSPDHLPRRISCTQFYADLWQFVHPIRHLQDATTRWSTFSPRSANLHLWKHKQHW